MNTATGESKILPLAHSGSVLQASYSDDGKWLATVCSERNWDVLATRNSAKSLVTTQLWNATTGNQRGKSVRHFIGPVTVSSAGNRVLVVEQVNNGATKKWGLRLNLIDVQSGKPISLTNDLVYSYQTTAARFSANGHRFLVGRARVAAAEQSQVDYLPYSIEIWNSTTGRRLELSSRASLKITRPDFPGFP